MLLEIAQRQRRGHMNQLSLGCRVRYNVECQYLEQNVSHEKLINSESSLMWSSQLHIRDIPCSINVLRLLPSLFETILVSFAFFILHCHTKSMWLVKPEQVEILQIPLSALLQNLLMLRSFHSVLRCLTARLTKGFQHTMFSFKK